MRLALLSAAMILLVSSMSEGQTGYTMKTDSLQSAVLGQNRKLNIYLPEGYDTSTFKFPVIYVLDAEGRDQHIVPTARFLFLNHKMPRAIIVGVKNIDRNHDFLPDSSKNAPTGGGADNFIRFFSEELIPYIDRNFRTGTYRVLIGHSYGGLFALYALTSDPELFDGYIAIDPSIWYKGHMFLKIAGKEFSGLKKWDRLVFITGREGQGMNEMGITAFDSLMKDSAPKDLGWEIVAYPDEDHGSVTFKSAYDGLRYIFDTGADLGVFPQTGIVPPGKQFDVYLQNFSPFMRYTTDGSEPDADSQHCTEKIQLTGGCTLKIKNVTKKYRNFPTLTFQYGQENFLESSQSADNLIQGLEYEYFEGAWDSLPDFSALTPVKKGTADNFDLSVAARKDSFALIFKGYLHIAEKDLYYIWITSDDGSELNIGNRIMVDNDGLHSARLPKVVVVPLNAGYFPVTLKYFEKNGSESLQAGIMKVKETPTPQPFDKGLLFRRE